MSSSRGEPPFSVVVADDLPEVRVMLQMLVEAGGRFQVIGEATNGLEAVDVVREKRPDVVLLDISMPRMDGLQALQSIVDDAPDTKVVMISGLSSRHLRPTAESLGAHGYIEKGFESSELLELLDALVA